MKVLVIGGGGREHALVWKLRQSPRVSRVYCAPGNAGIGELAELVDIKSDNIAALVHFACEEHIDLTVPGPELPLTLGIVDELTSHGCLAFGPTSAGAQVEGSKAFAKELMRRWEVPTARYSIVDDPDEAVRCVEKIGAPLVVKADGLAAGKGVLLCASATEAQEAIDRIMRLRVFGDAGDRVVIEELLHGEELSFMAVTDGTAVVPLASSQDHKRALDGDMGPNTGGMGAYSPASLETAALRKRIMREIIRPVLRGLAEQGIIYRGVLYAGLMITATGPKVLEFNVRFGDPECQALLVRFQGDLFDLMHATATDRLEEKEPAWDMRAAACVVLAAGGYPGEYDRGKPIEGLESLGSWRDGMIFHAGTARQNGAFVTNGGRVLGVTTLGQDVQVAVAAAYDIIRKIHWDGMQYRRDIGHRARELRT